MSEEKENMNENMASEKSMKRIRAGHSARLTKMINDATEAMKDVRNIKMVEILRLGIYDAFLKLEDINKEYISTLSNEAEVQRELQFIDERRKQANALEHEMNSWLTNTRMTRMSPPLERPSSRISSASTGRMSSKEAERKRKRAELELQHELRRQESEAKQKEELMRLQEKYELACLEESFESEDNHDMLNNDQMDDQGQTEPHVNQWVCPQPQQWIPSSTYEGQMPVSSMSNNPALSSNFSLPSQVMSKPTVVFSHGHELSPDDDLRNSVGVLDNATADASRSTNLRNYAAPILSTGTTGILQHPYRMSSSSSRGDACIQTSGTTTYSNANLEPFMRASTYETAAAHGINVHPRPFVGDHRRNNMSRNNLSSGWNPPLSNAVNSWPNQHAPNSIMQSQQIRPDRYNDYYPQYEPRVNSWSNHVQLQHSAHDNMRYLNTYNPGTHNQYYQPRSSWFPDRTEPPVAPSYGQFQRPSSSWPSAQNKTSPDAQSWYGTNNVNRTEPRRPTYPPVSMNRVSSGSDSDRVLDSIANMMHTFKNGNELPRLDITPFSGNPREFCSFVHTFSTAIENKMSDYATILAYLIHYCTGRAKQCIEHCVMLYPPELGLNEAKTILSENFGQPHIIANSYLQDIVHGPMIKPGDGVALANLAIDMRKCELALTQMGYASDINNSETLLMIMWRLPFFLQNKWVDKANNILQSYREPNFGDFTNFIKCNAQIANTFYGQNVRREYPSKKSPKQRSNAPVNKYGTTLFNSKQNIRAACLYCNDQSHELKECQAFIDLKPLDRSQFAREKRLCFNCLIPGHFVRNCNKRGQCQERACFKKHHTLFHGYTYNNVKCSAETNHVDAAPEPKENRQCYLNSSSGTFLRVLPVLVKSGDKEVKTYALLDTGSDVTLCSKKLVRSLGVVGKTVICVINTVSSQGMSQKMEQVSLDVMSLDHENVIHVPKVWAVNEIPVGHNSIPSRIDADKWDHLKGIELPELHCKNVDILIGSDTPEAFWAIEHRLGNPKEPYAVKTPLGWSLLGPKDHLPKYEASSFHISSNDDMLLEQVKSFWKSDFTDINDLGKIEMSKNNKKAIDIIESSLNEVDNHYQVALPWRKPRDELKGNYSQACSRLNSLKRRLIKNPELHRRYIQTVNNYIDSGHSHVLPTLERKNVMDLWFLPHHPVVNPEKPDKLRIVFDCAAIYEGKSLNNHLYSGPDVTSSLLGVLLRFRKGQIALIGDIKNMFHQIKMNPIDWNKLSFLWWPNGDLDLPPIVCQMIVHLFGATSSPFCANYCLRKTADDHKAKFDELTINCVNKSFYVDDCLVSVNNVDQAIKLRSQLNELLELGGFHLTKWCSNNPAVLQSIPDNELAPSLNEVNLELDNLPVERALGMTWDPETDMLGFKLRPKNKPLTKRGLLSVISSVYDPCGVVAPFCLRGKLILRELIRQKIGWDIPLTGPILQNWDYWLNELSLIVNVQLPRCYIPLTYSNVQIQMHHFCDASTIGYGVVSYLRIQDGITGEVCCKFVIGKSRLAPLKTVTVPRLELTSAVLAVKINDLLKGELDIPINDTYFWTDSTTVLKYISNDEKRFHTFVSNRLSIIENGSLCKQWRHVVSAQNPADDASRGLSAAELTKSCRWLHGPPFLVLEEREWPPQPMLGKVPKDDPEVKVEGFVMTCDSNTPNDCLIELSKRYSNWNRLLKAVSWLIRYKGFICSRRHKCLKSSLSTDELLEAERYLIMYIQRIYFHDVFTTLLKIDSISYKRLPRSIQKLHPFVSDGILRVGSRLSKAPVEFAVKYPIILPKCHLTRLIIQNTHDLNGHIGPSQTWTILRQTYWVLSGGVQVRSTIGNCLQCRKRNAKLSQQLMADLPVSRTTPNRPFYCSGVDFFGPMQVKRGRNIVNKYGCLFTCMASRAIHLELADDLSSSAFINAFRRFISRRGCPYEMFSDNGTNFVGANKELQMAVQQSNVAVEEYLKTRRVRWKFNPSSAPHMGGVWERLVKIVKTTLKCLLKEQLVTNDALHTLLLEVESIVNSRPLIPIMYDSKGDEPLTPKHLLGSNSDSWNPGSFTKADNYAKKRWRQVQFLADQFWRRWRREYLPLLQQRTKWSDKCSNLKFGDIVLVALDNVPRGRWPMARVIEVFPDSSGLVRKVKIKTKDTTLVRPITKLCNLRIV